MKQFYTSAMHIRHICFPFFRVNITGSRYTTDLLSDLKVIVSTPGGLSIFELWSVCYNPRPGIKDDDDDYDDEDLVRRSSSSEQTRSFSICWRC